MKPQKKVKRPRPKVKPNEIRPFRPGDRAALWFGRNVVEGIIEEIHFDQRSDQLYAVLNVGLKRRRYYPLWQLLPAGATRFSFHHLLYVVAVMWDKRHVGSFW